MRRFFLKLMRRRRLERDLEAELAFHREMAEAAGNTIPLGNASRIKESSGDLWRFNFLENLWRDIVYGARGLRRNPTLVLTAVVSLALGIGANTAMFSVAFEFLMSKPSVSDPGSLVYAQLAGNSHATPEVLEFVRQSGAFTDVAGVNEESFINWNDGVETHPVFSVIASKNMFTALGVRVAQGRGILPDDPDEVVVLSDHFWQAHFHGDPATVGQAIQLDGKPYTVVGILAAGHRTMLGFGITPDVYVPRYLPDTLLAMYIRLKPGMSVKEARAALITVAQRLDSTSISPFKYANEVAVTPIEGIARLAGYSEAIAISVFFAILLAIVGLVLLIACANVAALLLAQASARRKEIATRLTLGASRGRLLQQLLVESLLLSLLGAGCGLALAGSITHLLAQIHLPTPVPIFIQANLDWRAALYAALLTIVATLACGLLPARQAVEESIAPDLGRERKLRLRRTLVVAQIAFSLVVLTTGFLFVRNLLRSSAISPGFDLQHTLRATVDLPPVAYGKSRRIELYAGQALRELDAIPGVEASAAAIAIPFMNAIGFGAPVTFSDTGERANLHFYWNVITPGYFKVMDIPILQGRTFEAADSAGDPVAIVNSAFVHQYLGGRTPIGTTFLWGFKPAKRYRIVGVAGNTKNETIGEGEKPQMYQPLAQIDPSSSRTRLQFVIRSTLPPAAQLEPVRKALRRAEPAAGLEVATLYSSIGFALLPSQVGAALMGSAGLLGLLLTAIGLYGTTVYSVARRTQEIGIRMALGATRADISRLILLDSARLILAGSVIGLLIAVLVTRPLAIFLMPGLSSSDPLTFVVVLLVLALTGLIANWGPLRRAMVVDPAVSLRYE